VCTRTPRLNLNIPPLSKSAASSFDFASYLPFMILPLYASLEKLDPTLLEAAADLGCPRWKAFWTVTVPLALPGLRRAGLCSTYPMIT
jgi:ABC-type spermidine/putrescine transport system permease subunit I